MNPVVCVMVTVLFTIPTRPTFGATTGAATTAATATATDATKEALCPKKDISDDDVKSLRDILQDEFKPKEEENFRQKVDLMFMVDRSQSIGSKSFNEIKETVKGLLTRLAELQYILVHRDYTRVAVVSFAAAATAEIDGIGDGDLAVDACQVGKEVDKLQTVHFQGASRIAHAFGRASEIFTAGREDRSDPAQILWLFNDGECAGTKEANGGCKQDKHEDKDSTQWVKSLREDKVKIFVAGVGQWLDDQDKVFRLKNLASDVNHYACANTWQQVFVNLITNDADTCTSLFSDTTESCGDCSEEDMECGCDAISRTYECTSTDQFDCCLRPGRENCTRTTTTAAPTPPPPTPSPIVVRETGPEWVLPVAIGASAGVGVLLLILIITLPLLAVRRKKIRKEEDHFLSTQPIYEGPPLPPPPIIVRRRPKDVDDDDNIYANTIGSLDDSVDPSLQTTNIYSGIDYPQSYVNADMELDKDMPGWPGNLSGIKQAKELRHLAIRSLPKNRWAKTAGAPFDEKDFRELENIMRNSKLDDRKLKLAGKTYEIDADQMTNVQIHASRFIHKGLRETLWVSKLMDYVILGIGDSNTDDDCVRAVYEIHNHLRNWIQPEEDIYSFNIPQSQYGNHLGQTAF